MLSGLSKNEAQFFAFLCRHILKMIRNHLNRKVSRTRPFQLLIFKSVSHIYPISILLFLRIINKFFVMNIINIFYIFSPYIKRAHTLCKVTMCQRNLLKISLEFDMEFSLLFSRRFCYDNVSQIVLTQQNSRAV